MNMVRGLILTVAAVTVSGVTLVAPAVAQAAACPDVQVVFARGTGEPVGVGRVGDAFVNDLRTEIPGKSVDVYAVNYPASYDFLRAAEGANDASAFVQNTVATCPDTKIVLGGFSQGAAVIDAIAIANQPTLGFVNPMPAAVADHVAARGRVRQSVHPTAGWPVDRVEPAVRLQDHRPVQRGRSGVLQR